MKNIFIVARQFSHDSGSYAGMIQEFSKYASQKYTVKILCAQTNKLPSREKLPYAEVIRFPIPQRKIPLLGMNTDYLVLARAVRRYINANFIKDTMIIANTRAALGLQGHKYVLRMGQPAKIFLRNMEIAKEEVSYKTRAARFAHFNLQHHIEKRAVKNAAAMITSSLTSKQYSLDLYEASHRPHFIPHSGVKFDDLKEGTKRIIGRNLLFISAGKEKVRKGAIYLERALPTLFEKYPDLKLLHVGDRSYWSLPEKFQDRVIYTGRIPWSDMKHYYASSDVFVSAALNEWIPNTIFEAMAASTPVVTSDIDGIYECIEHKKSGYVFKRGSVEGIEKGVSYILDNPEQSKQIVGRAKEKAKQIAYPGYAKHLLSFLESVYRGNAKSVSLLK